MPLVFALDVFALIALQSTREETQAPGPSEGGLGTEVLINHRNRKFIAQQRGLDFALVQARHSSYFATKALSKSLFAKPPALEKQSVAEEVWKLAEPSHSRSRDLFLHHWLPHVDFKAKCL